MKRLMAWMLILMTILTGAAAAEGSLEGQGEQQTRTTETDAVRGYEKNAESEYQYLLFGTYPYEEDGTEAPLLWRILGREGQIITLFTEKVIDVRQVMEVEKYKSAVKDHSFVKWENNTEDFSQTDLFAWVNGEMTRTILKQDDFSAALVEAGGGLFHIMDNTEMRRTDWGFPDSTMGNTIENPGEVIMANAKNRKGYPTPYAASVVLYPEWKKSTSHIRLIQYRAYGNSSPYWTSKTTAGWKCGIIGGNGHISWHGKGDIQIGVRPAMVLDLSKLEIIGGDGTIDNPWIMQVKE